jgi:lipopolysaccharide transport system permease protein
MVIPAAAVGAGLVDLAIAALILVAMMAYYGFGLGWSALMLIPLVLLTALLALGVGMWMSGLNVKYRDVRYALPFCVQLWMYATPIIYPISFIPERWRWILVLNPLTGIIDGFRSALFGQAFHWSEFVVSTILTLLFLVYAAYSFKRMERDFADVI